ncbi:GNAT family N-acetyltransferase [Kineosporia sp. NBRC 101731]|uniref:GNAT family N-acetyltransferase n=1 Tax=Kineosporia sp. NBRC 101731 TaxID=3032199 RepID=UPI0024A2BE2E|nr:GNAT family N-acetyltransferase [Kineosporia sp. NBRC 101731]GLY32903.1 acetyltransferase [Kineosporia sp. NBRC 101731]
MTITWRRVTEDDFPLLRAWLAEPLVKRWWNHETTAEAVERDFGASARGEEPNQDWLALLDHDPFGLIQRSAFADYPEYRDPLARITQVPPGAMSLDYFVATSTLRGQGLGVRMISSMVAKTWADHPGAPCIIVPVAAGNRRSWRALEKSGFTRVAEGDLEPDNPIDPPHHVVYRLDRPA